MAKNPIPFKDRSQDTVRFFKRSHSLKSRILYLLLFSETSMVRCWVAWASIGWAFTCFNNSLASHSALQLMYNVLPSYIWGSIFLINGFTLLWGVVFKKLYWWSSTTEIILGLFAWGIAALSHVQAQGSIGPAIFGALIFFWLGVRFPSTKERLAERSL